MTSDCCFCAELAGAQTEFHQLYPDLESRLVLDTPNFVAMPSLGQLAPGHTLLLPKEHVTSFGELDDTRRREAATLYSYLRRKIASRFARAACFEHGSRRGARSGGCGIVHAHLHFVPLGEHKSQLPPSLGEGWKASTAASWLDDAAELARAGTGYLMWHGPAGTPRLELVTEVPSQSLRRHVAGLLGNEHWDWRMAGAQHELLTTLRDPQLMRAAVGASAH